MSRAERKRIRKRVYEIYGIPHKEKHKYQLHHIRLKSEGGEYRKGNLYPLEAEVHRDLHIKIARMENERDIG